MWQVSCKHCVDAALTSSMNAAARWRASSADGAGGARPTYLPGNQASKKDGAGEAMVVVAAPTAPTLLASTSNPISPHPHPETIRRPHHNHGAVYLHHRANPLPPRRHSRARHHRVDVPHGVRLQPESASPQGKREDEGGYELLSCTTCSVPLRRTSLRVLPSSSCLPAMPPHTHR